jgi:hypothetical protein
MGDKGINRRGELIQRTLYSFVLLMCANFKKAKNKFFF